MKMNAFILITLLLSGVCVYAQNYEAYEKTHYYEFTAPVTVVSEESKKVELVNKGYRFTVIGKNDKDYRIIFWVWEEPRGKDKNNKEKEEVFNKENGRLVLNSFSTSTVAVKDIGLEDRAIFILKESDFKDRAIPYYRKRMDWSAGFVVLPVKIRNSPTVTYSKDLSLGFSGGVKTRLSSYNPTYLNLMYNIGISSITADSLSTKGRIKQPSDIAALTTAIGLVFETHAFQFGLFYGWDRLSANDHKRTQWEYHRKPWVSLGIGLQILSKEEKGKNKNEGTNN
jgi:hypothetical protein